MRKKVFVIICVLVSFVCNAVAQNSVWFEQGKNSLVVAEIKDTKADGNVFNYIYVESELKFKENNTLNTFVIAARDQKWWDQNIWIHGELRTFVGHDILSDNIWLIGPSFGLVNGEDLYMSLQTLYRYDGKNNFQVTLLTDYEKKWFYYSMYIDTYGTDKFYLHSENRIFLKPFKKVPVRIGGNFIFKLNEEEKGLKCQPMAVVRVDIQNPEFRKSGSLLV